MQIRIEARKKVAKPRSLSICRASRPSRRLRPVCWPGTGGVAGRLKLYRPSSSEAPAQSRKVLRSAPSAMACWASQANTKLITRPATIQPSVPHTRTRENCAAGSLNWRNATALTSPRVGM